MMNYLEKPQKKQKSNSQKKMEIRVARWAKIERKAMGISTGLTTREAWEAHIADGARVAQVAEVAPVT